MKTMSRSRYHCLAWSFLRLRSRRFGGGSKRAFRLVKPVLISARMEAGSDMHPASVKTKPGQGQPGRCCPILNSDM